MHAFRQRLSGVFAPVTTPFRDDEVDEGALRENLARLGATALAGFFALGSNGEARSLNEREEYRVLEVFAAGKGDKVVMVGTGCESTRQTLEKIRQAAAMGFPLASVLAPHYFPKQVNDALLVSHYTELADNSPIPIVLYNAPEFAGGVALSPACVERLASHKNIAGMKDSSKAGPGAFLSLLARSSDFAVLAGSTDFFYPSLLLGAAGGVLSTSNYLPEECCRLFRMVADGTLKEATDLHHRLARVNRAVSGGFGVSGVKAAMDMMGFHGGVPRRPLRELSSSEKAGIKAAMEKEGFSHG